MDFSTYKRISYLGLVLFPCLMFGMFFLAGLASGPAVGLTVLLTVILVPMQFWQLSRIQDRLDDYGGHIPLSWAFDWDLEDDTSTEADNAPIGARDPIGGIAPTNARRECHGCGRPSTDPSELFCPRCGGRVRL